MNEFLWGMITMGFAIAGLIFLQYYSRTGDRLFAMFAISFWIMGINRVALILFANKDEGLMLFYVVRLLGFVLILIAILDKNRSRRLP